MAGAAVSGTTGGAGAAGSATAAGGGNGGTQSGGSAALAGTSGATTGGHGPGDEGGAAGKAGSAGASGVCREIAAEYAAELEEQMPCTPNSASQCHDRVETVPGCECRIFIQPADPFAIEHLSNVANGWFDQDCSEPSCPAVCSGAASGKCEPDPESPLGGRCVTP